MQTFFKFAELGEKHLRAGANYYAVKRQFDMFLLEHTQAKEEDRGNIVKQLDAIIGEIDRIDNESPNVPDRFYDQAKREQIEDTEGT